MPLIRAHRLYERTVELLTAEGLESRDAQAVADHLVSAELWQRPTHGVSVRLPKILDEVRNGLGTRRPEVAADNGSAVVIDGHDGFGFVSGARAAELLIERARRHRIAAVAVRNSGHTGLMAYYLRIVARGEVAGIAFAHCMPLMAPHNASTAFFGTNPVGFGFPADPDPVIVDFATSKLTYGEVARCAQRGEALQEGCAVDGEGNPTTEPEAARQGALLPFGGHKGSALALAVQLLAGPLIGALPVPEPRVGYGLLLLGIAHDAFQSTAQYYGAADELLQAYQAVATQDGRGPHVPGQRFTRTLDTDPGTELDITPETARLLGVEGGSSEDHSSSRSGGG